MALLPILQFPDPRLKKVALPVEQFDEKIKKLVQDMLETMYEEQGVGLAATQVNVHLRVIVIDVSEERNLPMVFINPVIKSHSGSQENEEGCLSFTGVFDTVKRAEKISVDFLSLDGSTQSMEAEELLGICLQHEIDHLNGITFYDHLSKLKQNRLRKKLEKLRRKTL